jgi:hypothetical protein
MMVNAAAPAAVPKKLRRFESKVIRHLAYAGIIAASNSRSNRGYMM